MSDEPLRRAVAAWNDAVSLEGRIDAALDGDRHAARFVLLHALDLLASGAELPGELRAYLVGAFREIVFDGLDAGHALGLSGRGRRAREAAATAGVDHTERGRGRVPRDRDPFLAYLVALRLQRVGGTLDEACRKVAEKWLLSESEVAKAWSRVERTGGRGE